MNIARKETHEKVVIELYSLIFVSSLRLHISPLVLMQHISLITGQYGGGSGQ